MYLWRRSASQRWFRENENRLRARAGDQLAVIERPSRKRLQLEVASTSRANLTPVAKEFRGRTEKLPRDWLKRALHHKTKALRVGNRTLIIPAGAAFGTGEHATTAMSLRLLERVMLVWGAPPPELVVDLGTGSGILALAAKLLGTKRAIGIDDDPIAISTAKQNAKRNRIRGVQFCLTDVRNWKPAAQIDIIIANLFSELLIEILPRLKAAPWLILSGILRAQEDDVRRALTGHKIDILEVRRRGKWVAIRARRR